MSKRTPQNYTNHRQFVPLYHFILSPLSILLCVAAVVHMINDQYSYSSVLLLAISLCIVMLTVLVRQFATTLQDRSILKEENSRHYRITGVPLDSRLSLQQIIALRFAEDDVFPQMCKQAADTGMEPKKIKQSVTRWRADDFRV